MPSNTASSCSSYVPQVLLRSEHVPCTTFIISLQISLFVRELGEREKRRDGRGGSQSSQVCGFPKSEFVC